MSSFLLFTKQLFRNNLINGLKVTKIISNPKPIGLRFLFTDEILGIPGYVQTRERIALQFGQMRGLSTCLHLLFKYLMCFSRITDKFFARMDEYSKSESKMMFTEDLKNIVFLAQNSEQELELVTNSIKKYTIY